MDKIPSENVTGAVIFWAYIVAAIYFTCFVISDLVALHARSHHVKGTKVENDSRQLSMRDQLTPIFICVSILSFAVLSYHMLSFLLVSYAAWSKRVQLNTSDRGSMQDFGRHIWIWSKSSSLFYDFATAICHSPARLFWTQQALLFSSAWNIFMAIEGMRYRIPHLWAYYVLGQILPISFAQNLFSTALMLSEPPQEDADISSSQKFQQWLMFVLLYFTLAVSPVVAVTPYFWLSLLITRILLFAPYWLARPPMQRTHQRGSRNGNMSHFSSSPLAVTLGFFLPVMHLIPAGSPLQVLKALHTNHAVSALGYDYLIGFVSAYVLTRNLDNTV